MRAFSKLLRCMDIKGLFRTPGTDSLVQFFRYAFVGDFAALVDLRHALTGETIAAVFRFFAGLAVNYLLPKPLIFQAEKARIGAGREFMGYALSAPWGCHHNGTDARIHRMDGAVFHTFQNHRHADRPFMELRGVQAAFALRLNRRKQAYTNARPREVFPGPLGGERGYSLTGSRPNR